MCEVNYRLMVLRNALQISQTQFGQQLGVSRSVIANYEGKKTIPKQEFINLVCKVYNVNPDWLINGSGEMFLTEEISYINEIVDKYNLSTQESLFLKNYLCMGSDERGNLIILLSKLINNKNNSTQETDKQE